MYQGVSIRSLVDIWNVGIISRLFCHAGEHGERLTFKISYETFFKVDTFSTAVYDHMKETNVVPTWVC